MLNCKMYQISKNKLAVTNLLKSPGISQKTEEEKMHKVQVG